LSQSDRVSTLKRSETSHIVEMACSDDGLEMQNKKCKVNSHDEIDSLFSMNSIEFLVTQATAGSEDSIYGDLQCYTFQVILGCFGVEKLLPFLMLQRIGNAAKGLVRLGTWLWSLDSMGTRHNRFKCWTNMK